MGCKIWESGDFCVAGGVGRPDYRGVKKKWRSDVSANLPAIMSVLNLFMCVAAAAGAMKSETVGRASQT
jgi:hypothetical protein